MKKPRQKIDVSLTEKRLRADVIKAYMADNDIARAVCFSCGNASAALKKAGVAVLDISPCGDMVSRRWFTQAEISRLFPLLFDATSGHLPVFLMQRIADRLRAELTFTPDTEYEIPSGSGETIVCLKMAFPQVDFTPVYDNNIPATEYSPNAPLNGLVRAMFPSVKTINHDE